MGDIVSIGDALIITLFSMGVVFVALVGLSLCISVLKNISSEKKPKITQEPISTTTHKEPTVDKVVESTTNDEELVAVIAAAIAASLGVSVPEVHIKSIRRIPQNTTPWAAASRREQIYGKL